MITYFDFTQRKKRENKIDFTRNVKEGQDHFLVCEDEEEGYKEKEENIKKRNGE